MACVELSFEDFGGNVDDSLSTITRFETVVTTLFADGSVGEGAVIQLYPLYIATCIWGFLFLVYIILSALPLSCTRCCCTTKCCTPKPEYHITGYPAGNCQGYVLPTIFWFLFWIILAGLTIFFPFALQSLFVSISNTYCVILQVQTTLMDVVQNYNDAIVNVVNQVVASVQDVGDSTIEVLGGVAMSLSMISDTISSSSSSFQSSCTNITTSEAYINLTSLAGGSTINFGCDEFALDQTMVQQINDTIALLNSVNASIVDIVAEIQDGIESAELNIFDDVNDQIDSVFDSIFSTFDQAIYIGPLTNNMPVTVSEAFDLMVQNVPAYGAAVCAFTSLGLFLWLLGVLVFLCAKCSKDQGGRNRAQEVRNSCGGRCLTKTGCICTTFGAFILCFMSIILLILSPLIQDVVGFYYVIPASMGTQAFQDLLNLLETEAVIDQNSEALITNISYVVDECFFGAGSVGAALSAFGFNTDQLIASFDTSQLDFGQYGNITSELDSAKSVIADAKTTLANEIYTDEELSIANTAATSCCNYTALFSIFVDDCSDPTSECGQCDSIPGDCAWPNSCSPSAADNGGISLRCNQFAIDAQTVMTAQNALLNSQSVQLDTLTDELNDVESQDPFGAIQSNVETTIDGIKTSISAAIDNLSCSPIGNIYYGIYEMLLKPSADGVSTIALVVTIVIAVSCIIVYIGICVDVRLGNDGIDLNALEQKVIRTVSSNEVGVELVESEIPVAQPMPSKVYNVAADEYGHKGYDKY